MSARIWLSSAALSTFAIFTVVSAAPSAALTAKECSAKYKAAKTAGTLKGETWNKFRIKYAQELNQQPNPSPQRSCATRLPRTPSPPKNRPAILVTIKSNGPSENTE